MSRPSETGRDHPKLQSSDSAALAPEVIPPAPAVEMEPTTGPPVPPSGDTAATATAIADEPPEHGRRAPWLLWALAALAVLALTGLWYSSRPQAVPLQGTIEAREVNVATRALARVESVGPDEGAMVRAGDILARLSSPLRDAAVAQSEAQLNAARQMDAMIAAGARSEDVDTLRGAATAAQAAAELASVTAGRMSRLYAQGVVSAQPLPVSYTHLTLPTKRIV